MRLPKTAAPFRQFSIKKSDNDSLKGFPKGTCFALSGVFFLLTLLVLFQSKEPFGIAAIVAYITSLLLTILLFSAPYFAVYFISYHRKLHQIEKAIVLLSEQKSGRSSPSVVKDAIPPYSSVSLIEETESALMENGSNRDVAATAPSVPIAEDHHTQINGEAYATEPTIDNDQRKTAAKKKSRNKTKANLLESKDEFQMSLFDSSTDSETESATSSIEDIPAVHTTEPTEIHAFMLLDPGNALFVRGDPPYSWEKGSELNLLDVGKYRTEPFEISDAIEVSFLINDNPKQMSERYRIEPAISNECYPDI